MNFDGDSRNNAVRKKSTSVIWNKLMKLLGSPVYWILVQLVVLEKWLLRKNNTNYGSMKTGEINDYGSGGGQQGYFSDDDNEGISTRRSEVHYFYNGNNGHSSTPTTTTTSRVRGMHRNGSKFSSQDTQRIVGVSKIISGNETGVKDILLLCRKNSDNFSMTSRQKSENEYANANYARSKIEIDSGYVRKPGSSVRTNSIQGHKTGTRRTVRTQNNKWNETEFFEEEEDITFWNKSLIGKSRRIFKFICKFLTILIVLGICVYLLLLLWPFAAALTSSLWEYSTSFLGNIFNGSSSIFAYLMSKLALANMDSTTDKNIIPLTEHKGDVSVGSASISSEGTYSAAVLPQISAISKDDYDAILQKLQTIETTLGVHQEKLALHEFNYNELRQKIVRLDEEMRAATIKGKTSEQILIEIMTFRLGETADGKSVNLNNLITILTENDAKEQQIDKELNLKILDINAKLAADSRLLKEHFDKVDENINELRTEQIRLDIESKTTTMEVDLDKIKSAILPVMIAEMEQKVKLSCETRNCPEPEIKAALSAKSHADIEALIRKAIANYDADKTGKADLALEPAGGSILSTRCTKSSKLRNSVVSLWGFKIWSPPNNPRVIIQPGVVPGECWAFEGSIGDVVIKLISPSVITGFTLEHIPKSISPYLNIDSAPYMFQVLGLNAEDDLETAHDFGTFSYQDNGEPLQYFEASNVTTTAFPIVELKILSNHGNLLHTCLYRFRVHGSLASGGSQFTATAQVEDSEPEV